jgi:hypothetical protein
VVRWLNGTPAALDLHEQTVRGHQKSKGYLPRSPQFGVERATVTPGFTCASPNRPLVPFGLMKLASSARNHGV